MSPTFDESTRGEHTREHQAPNEPVSGALWITVASRAGATTLPLPPRGRVLLGRSRECDVCIDDPSISRHHAALVIGGGGGSAIELEDLGSRNGTTVRGARLQPNAPVEVGAGDIIQFGSTVLVLQSAPTQRPRRILAHGYFELYLEGECTRAGTSGGEFGVARVRVGGAPPDVVEQLLAAGLSPVDQFATYAPGQYEILLLDSEEAIARARLDSIMSQLAALGFSVRTGFAAYPRQGRTPEELIAAAAPPSGEAAPAQGASINAVGHATGHAAGPSGAMTFGVLDRLQPLIRRVASGQINVLILGETGAGKEVMADTLHRLSPRAANPLLSINCAALSETLLDSELFGYERGAFTGAVTAKPGLLETAAGGTVFLDEIGEMPASIQAKLLRVIEQKQVQRIGALKPKPIDVRFFSATHRDLDHEVETGRFRKDLFFRLHGISLVVPPLRERVDEIPRLAALFVERSAKQLGLPLPPQILPEVLDALRAYTWPGNVRELRNVMERAVLLSSNGVITSREIPLEKMGRTVPTRRPVHPPGAEVVSAWPEREDPTGAVQVLQTAELDEKQRILNALAQCAGNQTQAAKLLGISRRTLVYRLTELDLPRPRRR